MFLNFQILSSGFALDFGSNHLPEISMNSAMMSFGKTLRAMHFFLSDAEFDSKIFRFLHQPKFNRDLCRFEDIANWDHDHDIYQTSFSYEPVIICIKNPTPGTGAKALDKESGDPGANLNPATQ